MTTPCTNHLIAGDVLLESCTNCGHALLLHPGPGSPPNAACIGCIMWGHPGQPRHKR